jgi:hypothetical protein
MWIEHQKLNIRSIARYLQPALSEKQGIVDLSPFLLWPPDLFALTSRIFSVTGAYVHVIAPPVNKKWPPEMGGSRYGDPSLTWAESVKLTGQQWRQQLNKILGSFQSFEEYFKSLTSIQAREKEVERLRTAKILPPHLEHYWKEFNAIQSLELEQNVEAFWELYDKDCDMHCAICEQGMPVCKDCNIWNAMEALLSLHAIADEACAGWGIRSHQTLQLECISETARSKAQEFAEQLLSTYGTMGTLYYRRGRVLPKRHTPDVGITLRSMSANLSFHQSSVDVAWWANHGKSSPMVEKFSTRNRDEKAPGLISRNDSSLSVLLFPWPFEICSKDFKQVHNSNINSHKRDTGFFVYDPAEKNEHSSLDSQLREAILLAKKETGKVDLVILPECALCKEDFDVFIEVLQHEKIPAYITGKRERRINNEFYENIVAFNMGLYDKNGNYFFNPSNEIQQGKHHRWKLDHGQIVKYNLGDELSVNKSWWEAINIRRRVVNFINIGEEITLCTFICEDLARQDPIADLIRTVGPSLVVTILMDGPQTRERWSAKYASVLSEDPGCAIIALTSYGMVKRSQSSHGKTSHSIALVNDCNGNAKEIEMHENEKGVLISLCLCPGNESLADGRCETGYTNNLIVGAIHHLKSK